MTKGKALPLMNRRVREYRDEASVSIPIVVETVSKSRQFVPCDVLIAGLSREDRWPVFYDRIEPAVTVLIHDGLTATAVNGANIHTIIGGFANDPGEVVREVLSCLPSHSRRLLLDISCLAAPVYSLLIRAIVELNVCDRFLVGYTEPTSYPDEDLTYGLSRIEPIPGFFGSFDPTRQTVLITLLGFEGRRTLSVFRNVGPDQTIAINPFPGFRPSWDSRSFESNLDFLNASGAIHRLHFVPASQPVMAVQKLLRLHSNFAGNWNVYVAPLSTKPLGFATCIFALMKDDVKVVYHYPGGSSAGYAKGVGRSWLYHFSPGELAVGS